MKAAISHGAGERLVVEEIDISAPGEGEVLVRVGACAICQNLMELYCEGRLKLTELIAERYCLEEINQATVTAGQGALARNVIVFA